MRSQARDVFESLLGLGVKEPVSPKRREARGLVLGIEAEIEVFHLT
jgi:hypothetical protein